jgi:hypothetical protein
MPPSNLHYRRFKVIVKHLFSHKNPCPVVIESGKKFYRQGRGRGRGFTALPNGACLTLCLNLSLFQQTVCVQGYAFPMFFCNFSSFGASKQVCTGDLVQAGSERPYPDGVLQLPGVAAELAASGGFPPNKQPEIGEFSNVIYQPGTCDEQGRTAKIDQKQ